MAGTSTLPSRGAMAWVSHRPPPIGPGTLPRQGDGASAGFNTNLAEQPSGLWAIPNKALMYLRAASSAANSALLTAAAPRQWLAASEDLI